MSKNNRLVKLVIFYSPHATAKNFKPAVKLFKEADIYVPEIFAWSDKTLEGLRQVSGGLRKPEELLYEHGINKETSPGYWFFLSELESIYGSHKPIIVFDLPHDHPTAGHVIKMMRMNLSYFLWQVKRTDFIKSVEVTKSYLRQFAELMNKREEYIVHQLYSTIDRVSEEYPDLKEKDELKVLVMLGSSHGCIYHIWKKMEINVERVRSMSLEKFDFRTEAVRRYQFNKEVSDELAAQVLLETLLLYPLISKRVDTEAEAWTDPLRSPRKIISRFTIKEIEDILSPPDINENASRFLRALEEKKLI